MDVVNPNPDVAASGDPQFVQTDAGAKDGLSKCARCGATEIALRAQTGMLQCAFCRFEWQNENALDSLGLNGDIAELTGLIVGSGAGTIVPSVAEVLTFKCGGCGAEVIIDTNNSTQSRCHWCRNKLSMNQQVENGAVPDMVLPFKLAKQVAVESISSYVKKRMFFAHPRFKAEFNPDNVMGVYLPYMVVDLNLHATLSGQGEHKKRSYTVKRGESEQRVYDADLYNLTREFDLHVNDLTLESSAERRDQRALKNTNNIINTIMPFDVENSVRYDSNYLAGFTAERRDSDIAALAPTALAQARDIARNKAQETLAFYDRGVRWDSQQFDVAGQRWVSAYLPVWLYSYYEKKHNGEQFLHYVAVNARTGETSGSVPVNHGKLLLVSGAVQAAGVALFAIFALLF